jgi:hypothetical protein
MHSSLQRSKDWEHPCAGIGPARMHTDLAQRGKTAKTTLTDLMLVRNRTHTTSATEAPHVASYDTTIMVHALAFVVRARAQPGVV